MSTESFKVMCTYSPDKNIKKEKVEVIENKLKNTYFGEGVKFQNISDVGQLSGTKQFRIMFIIDKGQSINRLSISDLVKSVMSDYVGNADYTTHTGSIQG